MVQLAKDTGITREGLYKAFSKDGNPRLDTVLKVLHALGLKLTPQAAEESPSSARARTGSPARSLQGHKKSRKHEAEVA
jgi:hypothetical protein